MTYTPTEIADLIKVLRTRARVYAMVGDTTPSGMMSRAADALQSLAAADAASECPTWREWAAKILASYPWVDDFKPEDSDDKYRDGVRYVLLCIECDGSGSDAENQEMKAIRDRWGFS